MKTPPGASLSVAAGPAFWKRLHHVQARGDPTRVNFRLRCTRGPHAGAQPGCRCSGGIPLAASSHPFSARCGGGRDPGVRGPGDGGRGTRGSVDLGVQGPRDGGTRVCSGPGDAGTRGAVEGSLRACVRACGVRAHAPSQGFCRSSQQVQENLFAGSSQLGSDFKT